MPPEKRPFILVDAERCSGCRLCEIACSMMHAGRCSPGHSRIRVLDVACGGGHVPVLCQACEKAPCIACCPMNARTRTAAGAVVTDEDRCIGCRACRYICPLAAPGIDPSTGKTMTCDLCADDNAGPWCVSACRDCGALSTVDTGAAAIRKTRRSAGQIRSGFAPAKRRKGS